MFVVRRAEIDFLRGARLDDLLDITVEVAEKKRSYVVLRQRALLGGERVAEALVQVACVRRADSRPAPIPEAYMERMQA